MSGRGICSRREAEDYIRRGWVVVDGVAVTEPGTKVDDGSDIRLSADARRAQARRVTVLLHKPMGYVSGQPEKGYPAAVTLLTARNYAGDDRVDPPHRRGLAPAGRLDIDSQGLLVLTSDGRVAKRLVAPDAGIEKEYLVSVRGDVTPAAIERLQHGLFLDGRALRPVRIDELGPGHLRMVLTEGRKRQIRRMCEQVGISVTRLRRVRIGGVRLGQLPVGKWRYLSERERF